MKPKSSAHYQREFRKRLREQGLVKKEVWIRQDNAKQLAQIEKELRTSRGSQWLKGENTMTATNEVWTTTSLFGALQDAELFKSGQASVF